jgi:hypothetical protein
MAQGLSFLSEEPRMAKTGKIHHPKDGAALQNKDHFAASGTAQDVSRVLGILTDTANNHQYPGTTLLDPVNSSSGQFWIIHFEIPTLASHLYTLEIFDRDDNTSLHAKTAFLGAGGYGGISISYPQANEQISCAEFAPYGTTTSPGGTMQGSLSCGSAQFTQETGPLNWVLYCVSSAPPGQCSLTVSQPGAMPAIAQVSVTFTCART